VLTWQRSWGRVLRQGSWMRSPTWTGWTRTRCARWARRCGWMLLGMSFFLSP